MKLLRQVITWLLTSFFLLLTLIFESAIGLPVLFFTIVLILFRTRSEYLFFAYFVLAGLFLSLIYPISLFMSLLLCTLAYTVTTVLRTVHWLVGFQELLVLLLMSVIIVVVGRPTLGPALFIWTAIEFVVAFFIFKRMRGLAW